jgi:deoxyribodipyrimidine photo-lyase
VLPVYILSDWKRHHLWTGAKRQAFLCKSLESLGRNLEQIGGRLVIRCGAAEEVLEQLIVETGCKLLFFNRDIDPFGRAVEARVEEMAARLGVDCRGFHDVTLHGPEEVLTREGKPYRVFTPYFKSWLALDKPPPLPRPRDLNTPAEVESLDFPTIGHWSLAEAEGGGILEGGERAARQRLKTAVAGRIQRYKELRDFPASEGSSRLSQDLRFGLVSPRSVYQRAMETRAATRSKSGRDGIDTFIKELAWREFYMAILWHFPTVLEEEFSEDWRGLRWEEPGETFEAWKQGRTGFPIVDAGMRELLATGHMHNRLRMITAMFLTKDLHVDWRLGEQFFMRHLVDGEMASNNGGWQWSAGTGADAAPYFRIQNPWSQAKRHDPEGLYIKRWVAELREVPVERLFEPPRDGKPIAKGYPLPCVDHAAERERTLGIFKTHRNKRR